MRVAYIFLNGEFPTSSAFYKNLNIENRYLFCADGGAKKAIELGLIPNEVWGDFDSLDSCSMKWLQNNSIKIKTFSSDKDFSDGELLINYVYNLNFNKIYVIGGLGGRIDHTLTNINLIFKYKNLIFLNEFEELFLVDKFYTFTFLNSKLVSFIPFSDEVEDITLEGFKYPLFKHTLKRGDSLCLSNQIIANTATIEFTKGKLLATVSHK